MSATSRSARLSTPGEVIGILVASAATSLVVFGALITLFLTVFIPALVLGGKSEIPDDFPVYPGAQLESAFASGVEDCVTVDATWTTSDDVPSVVRFYKERLATGAWALTDSREHLGQIDLAFEGSSFPHREGSVTVSSESYQSGRTHISLVMRKSSAKANTECLFGTVG
jgi:hypothetical protein